MRFSSGDIIFCDLVVYGVITFTSRSFLFFLLLSEMNLITLFSLLFFCSGTIFWFFLLNWTALSTAFAFSNSVWCCGCIPLGLSISLCVLYGCATFVIFEAMSFIFSLRIWSFDLLLLLA